MTTSTKNKDGGLSKQRNERIPNTRSGMDSDIVVISDEDGENDDERFERELELAKRLSLQEEIAKPSISFDNQNVSKIQAFVKNFKLMKFETKSTRDDDGTPPPKKIKKLDDDVCAVTDPSSDNEFSDDLPDLEDQDEPFFQSWVKEETSTDRKLMFDEPRSSTPQKKHVPIKLPIYDDVSSSENEGNLTPAKFQAYEDISSASETEDLANENARESNDSVIIVSDPSDDEATPQKLGSTIIINSSQDSILSPKSSTFHHHENSPFCKQESRTPSTLSPQILFNKNTKEKLANILKKISPPSFMKKESESPTSSRHFLDTIVKEHVMENECCPRKEFVNKALFSTSKSTDIDCTQRLQLNCSNSVSEGSEISSKQDYPLKSNEKSLIFYDPKKRVRRSKKFRMSTFSKCDKSDLDIRSHFEQKSKNEKISPILDALKPLRISIESQDSLIDGLSQEMTHLHLNTINSCFEEGTDFLDQGLQFISDYLACYEIPRSVFSDILSKGLILNRDNRIMLKSFKILLLILEKTPSILQFKFDTLKEVMEELKLGRGLCYQEPIIIHMVSLFLRILINSYEEELYSIKDVQYIRQTVVYKTFSYDCGYLHLRDLITWSLCCITSGEYPEVQDHVYLRHLVPEKDPNDTSLSRGEVPKILQSLQHLLHLGITVSSSALDCAKMISNELLKSYIYLTSIKHKKLLLSTTVSSLLRFRLVSLVLENHCEDTQPCDFPSDLRSVFECFFQGLPPRYSLTPPTTPQSDEDGPEEQRLPRMNQFSSVQVEEFVMLLYYAVQSYLQCKKRKGHNVLRRKINMRKKELNTLSQEDARDLQRLPVEVERLRGHILTFTNELSDDMEQYLMLMLCLC